MQLNASLNANAMRLTMMFCVAMFLCVFCFAIFLTIASAFFFHILHISAGVSDAVEW